MLKIKGGNNTPYLPLKDTNAATQRSFFSKIISLIGWVWTIFWIAMTVGGILVPEKKFDDFLALGIYIVFAGTGILLLRRNRKKLRP